MVDMIRKLPFALPPVYSSAQEFHSPFPDALRSFV